MKSYVEELLENNKRVDGREFLEFRKIEVEKDLISKAEGSSSVKMGNTHVIAGIKLDVGEPFKDTPNEGILIVNAEFAPIAAPEFEPGPPGEDAIELARVVDRGLRESKAIKLEELVIEAKEKVWIVFVDIYIINHDGNLLDASALASLAALSVTKIPKFEDGQVIRGEYSGKLPLTHFPINITVWKFKDKFILDPIKNEEEVLDTGLAISVREDDRICSLQKMGAKPFSFDDVDKMIDIAIEKSKELRKLVV
ncbi:MAG: exosome complex protein Rrp42 [Candidatus Aenigmarchaeota archaeon]|nr:exosome complex protein Rrp42 [Candidatus Aenigmarchaeota archaeon]